MERIYYDIVDIFAKDLEKNLNRSIEIDKKEKEIKIEEEIIRYEEKDIGVRSFSVPYFVKNQTIVKYDGTDKELINKIEAICTAYTDKEIEAIEETMPILKKYSEERKKNLEGVAIIWRDHFLEENVGLLTSMVRMGVKPEDVLAIDKGDSTKHREEITATFKKLGYQVDVLDNTAVANDILIEDGKRLIKDFIDNRKDKKIVILDDGAIVSRILTLHNYENVEAFVELTVTGLKRIGELKENELPYPVLNVAKSKLKRFITYKEIANTIFTRSIELLAGEKLVGRTVIQLGYGDLGEVLADRYSQYGARVIVIEPDVMKCIEAAEKGFTTYRTLEEAIKYDKPFLIVGASGYKSISKEVIEQLEDGTFITSGATADLNIFKEYEKEGYKYKAIPKYGTQYEINGKKITVLGNGRSVNLFDSEAIPNRSNDIFKASQLVVTDKIINGKDDLKNQVELDIVDKWIDESNILEEYYNLYFKRNHKYTGLDIIRKYTNGNSKIKFLVISADYKKDVITDGLEIAGYIKKPFSDYKVIYNELKRIKKEINENKYKEWLDKYHNLEVKDINDYFTEEDKKIFEKLGIKLKNKIYTEFECECLYMNYLTYYDDPECDLSEEEKNLQKSLDGTGVSRDRYNEILKKLEIFNEHFLKF